MQYFREIVAAVVVTIIRMPVVIGAPLVIGLDPLTGVVSSLIAFITIGMLSSTHLMINGPSPSLSMTMWETLNTSGIVGIFWILVMSGAIQILAGIAGLGRWVYSVPKIITQGAMCGIGISVVLGQIIAAFTFPPRRNGLDNLMAMKETILNVSNSQELPPEMFISFSTLAVLILLKLLIKKSYPFPPTVLTIVIVSSVCLLLSVEVPFMKLSLDQTLFGDINILSLLKGWSPSFILPAFSLAFISSILSLSFQTVIENTRLNGSENYDRELKAQGIANTICGFFFSLPVSGSVISSKLQIDIGARKRIGNIIKAVILFLVAFYGASFFEYIPMAIFPGILMYMGYSVIDIKLFRKVFHSEKSDFLLFCATTMAVISLGFPIGFLIGLLFCFMRLALVIGLDFDHETFDDRNYTLKVKGALTFISLSKFSNLVQRLKFHDKKEITIDCEQLYYIDSNAIDHLELKEEQFRKDGITLHIDWKKIHKLKDTPLSKLLTMQKRSNKLNSLYRSILKFLPRIK